QAALDSWRARHVSPSAIPIFLLEHEEQLHDWVEVVDGLFWVVCKDPAEAEGYRGRGNVNAQQLGGVHDLPTGILSVFGQAAGIFSEGDERDSAAPASGTAALHPFDLLAAMTQR